MKRKTAEQTLDYTIALLIRYLTELSEVSDTPEQQFAYGEKTAYTECLELLLEYANASPLDVETVFPL